MRPTPETAVAADQAASCARRCATNTPSGDGDLCSRGDAERDCAAAVQNANAVFGEVLPPVLNGDGGRRSTLTDDAVSSNAMAAPNCELPCQESWDRVSDGERLGEDILGQFPAQSSFTARFF